MSESLVTYPQYNWIMEQEAVAEALGADAAKEIMSTQAFTSEFRKRLGELLSSWADIDLLSFANGEMSEIYLKPVMSYFWDLKPPVIKCPEVEEFVAQDLVGLKDEICQKLRSIFESSVWSSLLTWARPRGQEAADAELTRRQNTSAIESGKSATPISVASFDTVMAAALSGVATDAISKEWLELAYKKASDIGRKAVKEEDITSDVVSSSIVDFISPLPEEDLSEMAAVGSNAKSSQELIQRLYDEHFSSMPPLSISGIPPKSIPAPNRDYFVTLSYEDGAKDRLSTLLNNDLKEYAKHALEG